MTTLEHPLPAGMRDLLPEEARSRRVLARRILECFSLHGYGVVTPPVFEFAEVLERGLGVLDPSDVLRFVEPESGEVAALRPDMTPQIARIIATRMRDRPAPHRIAYEGSVLRRRTGRARKHRQIPQVGVELAGAHAPEGDLEILGLAADALRAAGLSQFAIDVGDAGIVRALVEGAPVEIVDALTEALSQRDEAMIAEHAKSLRYHRELSKLCRIQGGADAVRQGLAILASTPAAGPAQRLASLFAAADQRGLPVAVDFGEVRGFAYYTGMMFHLYARGPGEAIGGGGRYDELLARFGAPMDAVGMGIDLDNLAWALREHGALPAADVRVLVVAGRPDSRARLAELRAAGIGCAERDGAQNPLEYARAWGFSFVLADRIIEVATSKSFDVGESLPATVAALAKGT